MFFRLLKSFFRNSLFFWPGTLTFTLFFDHDLVDMSQKGKRKAEEGRLTSPLRRSPRSPPVDNDPAMLLTAINKNGLVKEFFCDHALLSMYRGKQRPIGKFLTMAAVKALSDAVGTSVLTTHDKQTDRKDYRYKKEPVGGDFFKRYTNDKGVETTESDEEFVVNLPADGRRFACALLLDFVKEFGRKARTGDVTTSSAYIVVNSF